jgi:DNA end-binding protein Ku
LDLLRYASELRDAAELDLPSSDLAEVAVTDRELALAEQLLSALVEEWDPNQYSDEYRNDLLDLIKRKVEEGGRKITEMPGKEPDAGSKVIDITELLRRSVEAAEKAASKPAGKKAHEPAEPKPGRKRQSA